MARLKRSNKHLWEIMFGVVLLLLSVGLYCAHYTFFHDLHHILIYFVGDLAFLPLEILLVTLIIHRLLAVKEKQTLHMKINMAVGVFYSELGTELLRMLIRYDGRAAAIKEKLLIDVSWKRKDFQQGQLYVSSYRGSIEAQTVDLNRLKDLLLAKRSFLVGMLENQNLLEHASFTDLLLAVFHLVEELCHRDVALMLSDKDMEHLSGDIRRVYHLLIAEWVRYMHHLKGAYPYLYSLSVRTNPFDDVASICVV